MNEEEITILIIEDDKMFRDLAFQVFEGCDRKRASNAEEGFDKFKKYCPDITLLDIGLPDKSGLDLLPDLIGYDPEAFVVMLTASHMSSDVESAKKHGAIGYITKPFTYKKVEECIAKYHEYKRKLQKLTPEERAGNIARELKLDAINEDFRKHQEQLKKIEDKRIYEELVESEIKKLRLLFVDDYPSNREVAGKRLQKLGCTVDISEDGDDAVNMVRKQHYDIVLMDTQMPRLDGYEATRLIREIDKEQNNKQTIIIGMLEHTYEISEKLWEKAGMDNYLTKPAKISRVKELIINYINISLTKKEGKKDAE